MRAPAASATKPIALVLLGVVLSRFFGWGGAIAPIAAVLMLLFAQLLLRWWADAITDDYTAQVTASTQWNNYLTLYIHKPAHLYGRTLRGRTFA